MKLGPVVAVHDVEVLVSICIGTGVNCTNPWTAVKRPVYVGRYVSASRSPECCRISVNSVSLLIAGHSHISWGHIKLGIANKKVLNFGNIKRIRNELFN
jgi:hypothetical protein